MFAAAWPMQSEHWAYRKEVRMTNVEVRSANEVRRKKVAGILTLDSCKPVLQFDPMFVLKNLHSVIRSSHFVLRPLRFATSL